jgi:hypothetical protein
MQADSQVAFGQHVHMLLYKSNSFKESILPPPPLSGQSHLSLAAFFVPRREPRPM